MTSAWVKKALLAVLAPLDRLLARCMGGGFGLKDGFTIVNLLGGVASICFAILGDLWWASFCVMLGYLGDVLDGPVARLTGRLNRFGTELDSIADHTSQCVAPAFVVFLAYRDFSLILAFTLAALLIVAGSIRHARAAAVKFDFAMAWNGMPRPVTAFVVISFINSSLFGRIAGGPYVGIGLIVVLAALHLVSLPFLNHHGRRLQWWVVVLVVFWFASCAVTALLFKRYFFDVLLLHTSLYAVGSWIPMTSAELRGFFSAARRWKAALEGQTTGGAPQGSEEEKP